MLIKGKKPSIALIDDHHIVRKGMVHLIMELDEFKVVFDVGNFDDLQKKMKENRNLDILLMDIRMPDKSGFEVASWMKENYPFVKVLAFSSESDGFSIAKVMRSGAKGFVSKDCDPSELLLAIETVLKGDAYLSQKSFNAFSDAIQNSVDYFSDKKPYFTDKEIAIIKLACTDLSYKDIGDKLCISLSSIEDYRGSIFSKLGIHTRQELAVYAAKNDIV